MFLLPRFCRPATVFVLFVLAVVLGDGRAEARTQPTHPGLNRARLEATKLSDPDKGGAEGDAAVTSNRYDVLRYALDLRIDPGAGSLNGAVQMVFASEVADLQGFVFDLTDDLEITSVQHLNGPLPFTHNGDSVVVTLPGIMTTGIVDSVTVNYRGQPTEPTFSRGLMYRTYNLGGHIGPSVANMSQPAYAKYWWPCKDRPGDKFLATVALTVPDPLVAVSNGNLEGTSSPETGWITYYWRESYPIASYLVSVAVADYVRIDDTCLTELENEIPISHWVFPPDEDDALVDFAPMCEMIDMCEERFGSYPFLGEKYGHAEFLWSGAMEHQTVSSIGYGSLLGDGSRDWLIVHELGHQWFGDSLTPDTWADIWLNEGFATYTEALWREHQGGREAYLANLHSSRQPGIWAVQGPVYDPVPVFPGRVIYDKGAWILHMLRGRMGEPAFFEMLQEWAQAGERPGGTVTTEEFIDLAEQHAGEDLDGFFWPYLSTIEVPHVEFSYTLEEGTAGPASLVRVALRQQQSPVFDNLFPVVLHTASGSDTRFVHLDQNEISVSMQAGEAVLDVQLDPEKWVLWEPAGSTAPRLGLNGAYPNPAIDDYIYLTYTLEQDAQVVLSIHDARGGLVDRQDLGRVVPAAEGNEVVWDLKDTAGRAVASGVYWAIMEIDGRRSTWKFTAVR